MSHPLWKSRLSLSFVHMKSSPQSIETFYPQLARTIEIKAAIKNEFGKGAAEILKQMKGGLAFDQELEVSDLITDLVQNDCSEDDTFYGRGSDGFFPITICSLGPVSFIRASEFDDIGYFGSTREARAHAEEEYEAYGPFVDDPDADDEDGFMED